MLTTAGQATDRWWPLPGSSVSTSALQLLAGRPRDNSATGSPIHLHNIYLSTHLHHEAYVARCEYYRPYRAVTRPRAMLVYARDSRDWVQSQHLHCLSTHCDACFGQHWTHQIIFILPRRYTIHLEMKKNQDIAELFTCVFFKHSL